MLCPFVGEGGGEQVESAIATSRDGVPTPVSAPPPTAFAARDQPSTVKVVDIPSWKALSKVPSSSSSRMLQNRT